MCAYVYVSVYVQVCVHACIMWEYVCISAGVWMCMYICAGVCMHACAYVYICSWVCMVFLWRYSCMCMCMCTCRYMCMQIRGQLQLLFYLQWKPLFICDGFILWPKTQIWCLYLASTGITSMIPTTISSIIMCILEINFRISWLHDHHFNEQAHRCENLMQILLSVVYLVHGGFVGNTFKTAS